jgi:predicted dehydrogenase
LTASVEKETEGMAQATGQYRVGVIGTGRIASSIQDELDHKPSFVILPHSHAGAYAALPSTEIVAAADTNSERLGEFASRWKVADTYANYRDMLREQQLDIVSICTPTRSHREIAEAVATAGVKGVFLEKPVAPSLADVDRIIAAFEANNVKAVVNHTRTFDPYYRRIRELLVEGAIGEVMSFLVHWHEGFLFGSTHLFDLLRFFTGSEADWVFGSIVEAESLFDPGGAGMIRFKNSVDALINVRAGHAAPLEIDIVGTTGRIRIGGALFPELYTRDEVIGELVRRGFPGAVWGVSAMMVAVGELIEAIEQGTKPASDIYDGRAAVELSVAFHVSSRAHAPVALPVTDVKFEIPDPWGRS